MLPVAQDFVDFVLDSDAVMLVPAGIQQQSEDLPANPETLQAPAN